MGTNGDDRSTALVGVVVSCTNLDADTKQSLHSLVMEMGGSFTRTFSPDQNTHLICGRIGGMKFNEACRTVDRDKQVHVVKPSWLLDCAEAGERVDEAAHTLVVLEEDVGCGAASEPRDGNGRAHSGPLKADRSKSVRFSVSLAEAFGLHALRS